ncbi:conserved hypothetical protein [Verticillium alfalfae VaMs.102]|uniref:Uncharacterized protein n=1 Tax=Verticillium alfalfae (strain VaMs.102 / ATCC MYA-4576 / FGSC 10136) TaxID=526221 RepID=C9S7G8_VERA1|nr:conserved hypothetical protein [Verticillium alfalfae VaMs.102]EEY14729.1 conserved hypothetical protein [Verticillium alfalfae VaMs.102]
MPPGINHGAFASAGVIAVSVAVAAAIAIYESPELRRYTDDIRRRIAMALHSLGEGREELMYWNAIHLSKLEFQRKADEQASPAAQLPAATEGSSFDDFLRQDASGESNSFVFKTGANVNEGEAQVRRRNEGARGLAAAAAAAALANPFDDEYRIDPVELFDNANNVAPHHDDSMSDIYSATTRDADDAPPNLSVALSTATPDLVDVTTDNDTATERSTTLDRELDQDEYMTAGQDQDDHSASEAYASIQAWAQGSSSNFYSPLPMSPAAPMSEPEMVSEGVLTPTDSVSLAGSGEDIANDTVSSRGGDNSRPYDVLSESEGMMTPASWSEVGSVVSENDMQHNEPLRA